MADLAIIRSGGKQYLVKKDDTIIVDRIAKEKGEKIKLDTLLAFADDGSTLELGAPLLTKQVQAEVMEHGKGEKVRVSKFKAKVRYRRTRGFRASYTKLKITAL